MNNMNQSGREKRHQDLVSIIIPIYNMEKYLDECLVSVIAQSYKNIEIILINDGSTDKSFAICQKYADADDRIMVIDKKNEGLARTRECGLCHARGTYFVTIDADDILELNYIEELYNCIKINHADICVCGFIFFKEEKEQKAPIESKTETARKISNKRLRKRFNRYIKKYQLSDSWNKMYRRQFVIESNIHYTMPKEYNGTDLLYNYLLFFHNPRVVWKKKYLYRYRIRDNSQVRRKEKRLERGFLYVTEELEREAKKQNIYDKRMRTQIIMAYVGMMKYASLDIYMYGEGNLQRYAEFMNYRYKYGVGEFISASWDLPINMKLFHFILFTGNSKALIMYYQIRDRLKTQRRNGLFNGKY